MEIVTDFIFLASEITVDADWSHKIKRKAWKKSYDKPRQHIKKERGFRMGNTCTSMWMHVDVWQNQYNIVKLK